MAVWSEITRSKIDESLGRIDAEYYKPEYLSMVKYINLFGACKLGGFIETLTDYHANGSYETLRHHVTLLDKPSFAYMIRTTDLENDNYEDDVKYVNEHAYNHLKKTKLFGGEIIINKIGSAGNVYLMPFLNRPVTLGMNQFMIRVKNSTNPYFIYTYLKTKFGQKIIERQVNGTVPLTITKDSVREILIPLIDINFQNEIGDLVCESLNKKQLSQSLYKQAQQLLEKELGLDKIVFEKPLSYEASFSEILNDNRADADYYQVKYKQLRKSIIQSEKGYQKLIDIVTPQKPNCSPDKNPKKTYSYIELSDINSSLGIVDSSTELLGIDAPSRAKREVSTGDIIASAVVGSVDKAALVDNKHNGCIASTGFFHFKPKSGFESEYLLMLIRSKCITMQLQQESTGGILSAVPDERLKNIIIPKIDKSLQSEIAKLVRQSHENYYESHQLLEQAKRRVEELIEEAIEK